MARFVVEGGSPIKGEVKLHGAKNSVLPILAASYLCKGKVVLHNCPRLTDVSDALEILSSLGCKVSFEDHSVSVDAQNGEGNVISDELMRKMRSSVIFLGAIAGKTGKAVVTYPGGCELGARPIDLHLKAFRAMGMTIEEANGTLYCSCENGLQGTELTLDFPSVGATENIMLAAVTAEGETVIINAAKEPEICDLAEFLRRCGAKIKGDGESVIKICGVKELCGCEYEIMPDRIEAATLLSAAAVGGELFLRDIHSDLLHPVFAVLKEAGCVFQFYENGLYMKGADRPGRIGCVRTMPHPGFPTDAQAVLMALCSVAKGTSVFIENIFENRFRHAAELSRMGAIIKTEGRVAVVEGVERLRGAQVKATDLRGGAALVLAALFAEGVSEVTDIYHIDRGYEDFEKTLTHLGAKIKRK